MHTDKCGLGEFACAVLLGGIVFRTTSASALEFPAREGRQWAPYSQWSLRNPTCEGDPYDLVAKVTFVHSERREKRTTEMFYDGGQTWKFRFTATHPGRWTFRTSSSDPDLHGHHGTLTVKPNDDAYGFVTQVGNKWARPFGSSGELRVFVPQYVMYDGPDAFYRNPRKIDGDVETFLVGHGFTGFHVPVFCRWFDLEHESSNAIRGEDPSPDPRTFEALELLITKVHAAGGVVHLWAWGDESRKMTPARWGIGGTTDKRLQRYIAARLGPLPGWTMGYGFDLWEWVEGKQLSEWHDYLHAHFGWSHMLGARAQKNKLSQLSESLDYSSYEQHRPDYAKYVETIERRPKKPSFSEDRFRIRKSRQYASKDYSMEMTRQGLWRSAMAGGVANIWGNLIRPDGQTSQRRGSFPYPKPHWIKTYSRFFRTRFFADVVRDNSITDGMCLRRPGGAYYVFYKEGCTSIRMDLSKMPEPRLAVAVDAVSPYREIDLGLLKPGTHTWKTPYHSDWAVALGD